MPKAKTASLDRVFAALSDPTRRQLVSRLHEHEATISELAGDFDMSFQAVSKHLKVLDNAGLLTRKREGKFFRCGYNPQPLNEALRWISFHHDFWKGSFDSLDAFLTETDPDQS